MARLQKEYDETIRPELIKQFGYKNKYAAPRLEKVIVSMGVGEATQDKKKVAEAADQLTQIVGQKAIVTKATKSIAAFKLREGMPIGAKATLRGKRMYEFLDRLVNIALPRVRDFRGLPKDSFDGRGNYSMGLKEQIVFPEIDFDKVNQVRGLNIAFVTTANTDAEAKALLKAFNMPIPE